MTETPPKPHVDEHVCPICAEYHPAVHEARADKLEEEAKGFDDDAKTRRRKLEDLKGEVATAEARRGQIQASLAGYTDAQKQAFPDKVKSLEDALKTLDAQLDSLHKQMANVADEIAADQWLANKRRADAAAERAEAKKERDAMEKCEKEKCHPKTIGMIDLRVGGAFDVTKEDDQVAVGADACFAIPGAPILDACFSPRIQTGGGSTILQLPAAAQLEVPISPQVVFAPRLGVGWSLQTFGQAGSLGSLLVMPEVGGKYLVNDKVEIGADVASLPMYFNDVAFQAQYRAMVYGGFRL